MKNSKSNNKLLYILSIIIPMCTIFIGFLSGGYAPFGAKNILSAGDASHLLSYYYELYDRAHEGTVLGYSNTSGLGYDFNSVLSFFISDPINFLIIFFPRNSIISVLNILYMLKASFASFSMCLFLLYIKEHFKPIISDSEDKKNNSEKNNDNNFVIGFKDDPKSEILKYIRHFRWDVLALSTAYALSLHMISIGMNISYTSAIAIFPLIMLGLEKIIFENKSILFVIALSLSVVFNLHITIISLLFIILFTLTRDYDDAAHFVRSFVSILRSVVLSMLCTSFITVSCFNSDIWKDNLSLNFPSLVFDNPISSLRQLISHNILAKLSMYGTMDISLSVFLLFFIVCYIFQKNISISTKLKNLLLLIFIFSGTFISTSRYLLNGFYSSAGNSIHFSYIICFFFIYLTYVELHNISNLRPVFVMLSFVITAAAIVCSMFFSENYDNSKPFIQSLEFLFGYFIILIVFSSKSMTKTLYILLTALLVIFEIVVPNTQNINEAGHHITSQSVYNTRSLQIYETTRHIHETDPNAKILVLSPELSYDNPLTLSLSGYDYVITYGNEKSPGSFLDYKETFHYNDSIVGVGIFTNEHSLNNVSYPSDITNYEFNKQDPFDSTNHLVTKYFKANNIFRNVEFDVTPSPSADNSMVLFELSPKENCDNIYFSAYSTSYYGNNEESDNSALYQVVPTNSDSNINYSYTAATIEEANYSELIANLASNNVTNKSYNNNLVQFTANSSVNGFISTELNNIKTLSFKVNGQRVNPVSIINNNALLPVDAGQNIVTVTYSYVNLIIGIIISCFGIILTALIFHKSKKKSVKTDNNKALIGISDFFKDNKVYILSLILSFVIYILSLMITCSSPFGQKISINGDGILQSISYGINQVNQVKKGNVFPSVIFNIGAFSDCYRSTILNLLLKPWNIIIYKLISTNTFLLLTTFEYILYSIMPCVSIIFYLTHRHNNKYDKHDMSLVVYASLYSLSSYSFVFFSYSGGLRFLAFLPLVILGIEQLAYNKKPALYVCMLILIMLFDPFHAFLLCEFLVLYFFMLEFDSIKDLFIKGIRFAIHSLIAALISAFSIVPFYFMTASSPYVEGDKKIPSFTTFFESFFEIIKDYRCGKTIIAVSDNHAQAATYCGLIMLFVIPLYLINNRISIKTRIKTTILIAILLIATNNEFLNYVFHGFHFQSFVPNRFAAFIVFIMIITLADSFYGNFSYNKKTFSLISIPITLIYFVLQFFSNIRLSISQYITIGLLVLYFIFIIFNIISKKELIRKSFLYIALIDIIINAFIVLPVNLGTSSDIIETSNSINRLSNEISDLHDFDKLTQYISTNSDYTNVSLFNDTNSLSFFGSGYSSDTIEYMKYYSISVGTNTNSYIDGNPLADMMLHVKYHVKNKNENTVSSIYPQILQQNELSVYENNHYLPLGMVIEKPEEIKKLNQANYKDAFDFQNDITASICGKNIYKKLNCSEESASDASTDATFVMEQAYSEKNSNTSTTDYIPVVIKIKNNNQGRLYLYNSDTLYYTGTVSESNDTFQISIPIEENNEIKPHIAILDDNAINELYNVLSENTMENVHNKGNVIEADIDSSKSGMLYISLPYYEGWSIYIDNTLVEKERFMGGIGVPINSGKHIIRMEYHSPGAKPGACISLITIFSIAIIYIINTTKKKQH